MLMSPWMLPRTRVGRIALIAALGCVTYALFTGTLVGMPFFVAAAVSMGLGWVAVFRHNERSVALWLMLAVGTGWLLSTSVAYLTR